MTSLKRESARALRCLAAAALAAALCASVLPGCRGAPSTTPAADGGAAATASVEASQPAVATNPPVTPPTSAPTGDTTPTPSTKPTTKPKAADTSLHTPAVGSPERKAILNALRPSVEDSLDQAVIFKCSLFRVHGRFAFVMAQPLQPNGKPIDYSTTQFADEVEWAFEDQVVALLKRNGEKWKVVQWNIGATDVVYSPWPEKYGAPRDIFGL